MGRPRKSTRDAWLDEFADVPIDTQENWLEMAEFVHRQAKRKRKDPDVEVEKFTEVTNASGVSLDNHISHSGKMVLEVDRVAAAELASQMEGEN